MRQLKRLFFIFLFIILCFSGCEIYRLYRLSNSRLVTKPDKSIQSTIEYLEWNEQSLVSPLTSISISNYEFCLYGTSYSPYNFLSQGVSWYINGTRIPDWMYDISRGGTLDHSFEAICLNVPIFDQLEPGKHLFGIHLQTNPFDNGLFYQWVVTSPKLQPTP